MFSILEILIMIMAIIEIVILIATIAILATTVITAIIIRTTSSLLMTIEKIRTGREPDIRDRIIEMPLILIHIDL